MDVLQVSLVSAMHTKQFLDRSYFLDLASELCWVHIDCGPLLNLVSELSSVGAELKSKVDKVQFTQFRFTRLVSAS